MLGSAAQRHRVNRVINFTQSHLSDALDLERLADVACLSKYHFTRVFKAHLGETPCEFLWRARLEQAARDLVYVYDRPITDVALDYGFASSQAFSRAFRQRFRLTPRLYRSANKWLVTHNPDLQRPAMDFGWPQPEFPVVDPVAFPVRIEIRPSYRVAYLRRFGSYGDGDGGISASFSRVAAWARSRGLWRDDSCMIGLCPNNKKVTPRRLCIYDACMPVPADVPEDDVVSIQTIPVGTYAVLSVRCMPARLYAMWEWLAGYWLPRSGRTRELTYCYEFLPPFRGGPGHPRTGVELCMRIKPSSASSVRSVATQNRNPDHE